MGRLAFVNKVRAPSVINCGRYWPYTPFVSPLLATFSRQFKLVLPPPRVVENVAGKLIHPNLKLKMLMAPPKVGTVLF
jgi:hypothetical protein